MAAAKRCQPAAPRHDASMLRRLTALCACSVVRNLGAGHAVVLVRAAALLAARGQRARAVRNARAACSMARHAHSRRILRSLACVRPRQRETRVFCKTAGGGAPGAGATILRERSFREETFDGLRARCAVLFRCLSLLTSLDFRRWYLRCRGAPATVAQFPDAETASQVLLAAGGPVVVTYERLDIPAATM